VYVIAMPICRPQRTSHSFVSTVIEICPREILLHDNHSNSARSDQRLLCGRDGESQHGVRSRSDAAFLVAEAGAGTLS